jgi:hypothetical protein
MMKKIIINYDCLRAFMYKAIAMNEKTMLGIHTASVGDKVPFTANVDDIDSKNM